jgi:hypothetical protein
MRFVFVDRIVKLDVYHRIETSKHVSGLDDVFADHFPGSRASSRRCPSASCRETAASDR